MGKGRKVIIIVVGGQDSKEVTFTSNINAKCETLREKIDRILERETTTNCTPLIVKQTQTLNSSPLSLQFLTSSAQSSHPQEDTNFSSISSFCFRSLKEMAISSYPTPSDAGVLCVILANTAISISIVKEILRSILHVMGIHIASSEEYSVEPTNSSECHSRISSDSYVEEFRNRTPSMSYASIFVHECPKQECSICLSEFEPKSEINQLSCGHVFHKSCLEKWLNYWNTTCPLCRNLMMLPQEVEEEDSCPM